MPDLPAPDLFTIDLLRNYLLVGAALFALGMLGFLSRRNLIVMFLSAEMMLQGTALSLVGFGRYHGNWTGQVFTIVILTVAACEASIAMALVVVLYNRRSSLDVTLWQDIREATVGVATIDEAAEAEPIEAVPGIESYPQLTPAGVEPAHPVQSWTERRR
ncbi:MAG: NADH-quinone oxidoreductase subunit NuoK [Paludisphaera borealis]|uniref:NADH-quinone oxidoreductase subunit NuoK n=1 Tax=Paludisphaera borealis TaxID=1387353 RepID=UPI002842534F|nr:NADH-quinone oxidoreductase subunit NuoK [Paludisphaera borealis]MDR3623259.1 NADH-quinone oxidoreductase subunit NuoK [Paludisphaera borealis]